MAPPFRQQIDEGILDQAAALFARRGFTKTSVQDVADAVGLSKAGLLHHYASKETLYRSVLTQAGVLGQRVLGSVGELPPGPERDRRALEVLVDVALAHPGMVALLLAPITQGDQNRQAPELEAVGAAALQAFGVDPGAPASERAIRVLGALAALAVLSLTAHQEDDTTRWRASIIATCFDALGHSRPGVALPDHHQVEA
ncbi:helix-turn-helix domain-containing protein [Blastococcus sp. BMG 814]|uniref:Helix-turn-helix domain-containing protein n=1 Tax=Blastococcus carthaginiensis TaxID=3050034 RepID=A0ABT9I9A4_9ACTN|nr:helix-turn-helix domain-containing protein [Blastococcus carthaginiensis]MDP5181690.1 helix-turn-helix domain-containing protein [Blastococcus carthaginiensis]